MEKTCEKKAALMGKYQKTTRHYSDAVSELKRRIGTSSKDEFQKLKDATEEARKSSFQAMRDLENHIADHTC